MAKQNASVRFVTIMPCYDKKLEAVRPKMQLPAGGISDEKAESVPMLEVMEVDTVLASHEVLELLERYKTSLADVQGVQDAADETGTQAVFSSDQGAATTRFSMQSNGYLEYIFRKA